MKSTDKTSFASILAEHGLELTRTEAVTLQINVGFLCNQACRHCHLEASPTRTEIMGLVTFEEVAAFAERSHFKVIDITGGAPELNPNLTVMIPRLAALADRLMLRSNLTTFADHGDGLLVEMLREYRVVVVASLPSLNPPQLDAQRGQGVFRKSVEALLRLNSEGFGQPESGLELDLVANPTGAFFPAPQAQLEKKFRNDLQRKWGIVFNKLFTFANVPLGRFRSWLEFSGNLDAYQRSLASGFNPCTVAGLMCRSLISVSWDGYLYDCDFNLAQGIPAGNVKTHVSQLKRPPGPGAAIAVSDLCYACTAGSGFT